MVRRAAWRSRCRLVPRVSFASGLPARRTKARSEIEFYRCGWDAVENDHEKANVLILDFDPKKSTATSVEYTPSSKVQGAFKLTAPLEGVLDPEHHALSVVITVTKKTSISLVAVEFGYPGDTGA